MHISSLRARLFEYPTTRRRGDAHSPAGRTKQGGVLVELHTDEGVTGVSVGKPGARAEIERLGRLLEGADPREVRGLWRRLVDRCFKGGNVGIANDAIAALDVAVWDVKAKAYGEPLWRLLGASRRAVRAYASGGDMPLSDAQLREFYQTMAGHGFTAGKLKVGLDQDADLRRIGIMRDALRRAASRPALMVDASEYWSVKQAIRKVTEMERSFDLTWVEEPVAREDAAGLAAVTSRVRSAVAAGENLDDVSQFVPYVAQRSADIIQVNWTMGGITGALRVAALAEAHNLPVIVGESTGKFMAHVAAALPNHMMLEVHEVAVEEPFITAETGVEDGHVTLAGTPGLGLAVDEAKLGTYLVDRLSPGTGTNPYGRREGAGTFEVPPTDDEVRRARQPIEAKEERP